MTAAALGGAYGTAGPADALLAPAERLVRIDTRTATPDAGVFDAEARFEVQRDGTLHGFSGHLEAELAPELALATQPGTETSWPQQLFPFEAVPVREGDVLEVLMHVGVSTSTRRRLAVRIEWALARDGRVVHDERGLFPET